jgi:hypothetical protein
VPLPPYTVYYRGKPACPCLAQWYPAFEAELQRRGILQPGQQVYIYQLIGGADASAGTHTKGGAADDNQISEAANWVARQMGADASWTRSPPAFTFHAHRVLRGCPHNGPAAYQIAAVDAGYNGLGGGGRGGPDDGPRPLSGRTWQQGIAWAIEQGDEVKPEDIDAIADAVVKKLLTRDLDKGSPTLTVAQALRQASNAPQVVREQISKLAAKAARGGQR